MNIENLHKHSRFNRDRIAQENVVSCYQCIRVFPIGEITEWTDSGKTAICPHCWVDALVPGEHSVEFLKAANSHWFLVG